MKLNNKTRPLYTEAHACVVRLGAVLLQARSGTSCPSVEAPDNNILRPIALMSKSPSSAEKRYSNIEREALGILYRLKSSIVAVCKRGEDNYRSQTPNHSILKRCSNTITETMMHSAQNTPIQIQDHIQAWTRSVQSGLAIHAKPQGKQRCKNTWYAAKY